MGVFSRLFGNARGSSENDSGPPEERPRWTLGSGSSRRAVVSLFVGDLIEAPADAICTSSNPRLSLFGGTGRAVVAAGGWSVRTEAQDHVARERDRTGQEGLEAGSVVRTGAGRLPHEAVLHCVASDESHRSSDEIVRACVEGALGEADRAGISRLALPVFAAGHAAFPFADALNAMLDALEETDTEVDEVILVVYKPDQVAEARRILEGRLG